MIHRLINFSSGRESIQTVDKTIAHLFRTIQYLWILIHASNLPCRYSEEFNGTILITRVMASNYDRIITMYHVAIITESNDLRRSMKLYLLESDNTTDLLRRQRRKTVPRRQKETAESAGFVYKLKSCWTPAFSQESVHRRAHVLYRSPP